MIVIVNKIILFLKTLTEKQILLLLLGITFGLRLYAVLMAKGIAYDSASYGFMARDFLNGNFIKGLSSTLHPFYPFLISLVSFDSANVEIAGRLISLFFGTLTLIPVFYLTKEVVNKKAAVFSGLFYSFHPYLATYSGMLLSEATYWGLLSFSIYCFWAGLKKRKILWLTISGFLLALAYLTRPEGIGYFIVFLVWIVFYDGLRKGWFKKFLLIGALLLPLIILTIPYLIHIHRQTGQWFISKKALEVQSQFLKWSDSHEIENLNSKIAVVANNIAHNLPFTIYHYLRAYHFTLWLFLFFGLIRSRQKGVREEWYLASFVLLHLFSLSTFLRSTIRFSVPMIPISLFWAGAGVLEMQRIFQKIKIMRPEKWVFALIALFILIQLPQTLRPERRHREEQKKIALWLRDNTPKDAIIMSNSPQETFYANRKFVLLPQEISSEGRPGKSYKEVIEFAKESKIKYILVDKNTVETNADFVKSINESDLKELYRHQGKDGKTTIIYEVLR
jgi:hypothetical protein